MLKTLLLSAVALLPSTLAAQSVPHAIGTVHTQQVDLGYETFGTPGSALPVIAVNGGPGLSHKYMMQNDVWQRIARHRLVVLYDQRGTGASKRLAPDAPQTMDAQVADLDTIREHLHLDTIALVGDSYGGLLSMAYTAAHPDHVRKLVLSDSPGPSWKSIVHLLPQVFPDVEEQSEAEAKRLGPDTDAAAQAGLVAHFRMIFYSQAKLETYLRNAGDLGYVPAVGNAVGKATQDLDLSAAVAAFHLPTLVLNGRYDMNVAPLTAWRLAHTIPGAKVVFFEQSGHLPSYEEPDRYVAVLNDFLTQP